MHEDSGNASIPCLFCNPFDRVIRVAFYGMKGNLFVSMAFDVALPFVHPALLALSGGAVFVTAYILPEGWPAGRRWGVAMLAALVLATLAVVLGMMPLTGEVHLAAYSLFLIGGFLASWGLLRRRFHVLGLDQRDLSDMLLVALVLGVIGARARYVMERWDSLVQQHGDQVWWVAVDLDRGGAVWYGGLFLATCGILVMLYRRRVSLTAAADVILPAVLVGLGVGRLGCFVNGCCYGAATTVPWAVPCPLPPHHPVHPTQLYESGVTLILGGSLWYLWAFRSRNGQIAAWAMVTYGLWRFMNEGLRGDHDVFVVWPLLGRLTTSQGTSLLLVISGLMMLGLVYRRPRLDVP